MFAGWVEPDRFCGMERMMEFFRSETHDVGENGPELLGRRGPDAP